MLAKFENGLLKVAHGRVLHIDDEVIVNPRSEDFIRAGYKEVIENKLEDKEGFYQVPEYTEDNGDIIANYHYEEIKDEEI